MWSSLSSLFAAGGKFDKASKPEQEADSEELVLEGGAAAEQETGEAPAGDEGDDALILGPAMWLVPKDEDTVATLVRVRESELQFFEELFQTIVGWD